MEKLFPRLQALLACLMQSGFCFNLNSIDVLTKVVTGSSLNEKAVKSSEEHAKDVATQAKQIAQLEQQLKENLRFNNIEETEGEDCKALVISIIQNEFGVDVLNSYPIPCSASGWEKAGR